MYMYSLGLFIELNAESANSNNMQSQTSPPWVPVVERNPETQRWASECELSLNPPHSMSAKTKHW